ncbi:MAG TPA: hypothetical protein VK893_11850, partial [Pyrinomonadaceae bacterium]|nr:hypothetical protein [Pyrinomonadaceae bacterium]
MARRGHPCVEPGFARKVAEARIVPASPPHRWALPFHARWGVGGPIVPASPPHRSASPLQRQVDETVAQSFRPRRRIVRLRPCNA